ncbi:MAG: secondary thiamine-phosphate synthase enzyme YjbQ [Azospirillaceae bacterium]|nr:secondary thiamine-phosphate synthase enzyme YjbQ [Azospirillaceae bacterium]
MRQALHQIEVMTTGPGLVDITAVIIDWVAAQRVEQGLLTVFLRHTSASLLIQENAAPDVRRDLDDFFRRLVPEDSSLYRHNDEGPDDMPAHIRAALTAVQLSIPVDRGRPLLGTWQGVYLFEHRRHRQRRSIALHLIGD